jgi:hypothetical protein
MYDCFRCQLQRGSIIYIWRTYERFVDCQQCCTLRSWNYLSSSMNAEKHYSVVPYYDAASLWRSWLGHCATGRKGADSIPDDVIGIFNWHNPSGRTMADYGVDSACNRNEYQEYFLGGKGGRSVGLTTLPTYICRLSWNLGTSLSWHPQGLSRPVQRLTYLFNGGHLVSLMIITHCIVLLQDITLHVFYNWHVSALLNT